MDAKDKKLLELLQKNGRESLTNLSKAVKLSIDATNKRIKKLHEAGIIHRFGIFINPKAMGYDLVATVQIKLNNISEEELNRLISYLKAHKNVIELITLLGEYDVACVLIAKNTEEMDSLFREIRQKFKSLIAGWRSEINLKVHKFEEYSF